MNLENRIFKITKRASLDFDESNPGFVSFRNMNASAARSSVKKLKDAGFDAEISLISKDTIIIQRQVSVFGNPMNL